MVDLDFDLLPESEDSTVMLAEYEGPATSVLEPEMLSPAEAIRLLDEMIRLNQPG